jgi:hypothetical protein
MTITGTDKLSLESTKCVETTCCFKEGGEKGKLLDGLITAQYPLLEGKESNKMRLYKQTLVHCAATKARHRLTTPLFGLFNLVSPASWIVWRGIAKNATLHLILRLFYFQSADMED